MNSLTTRSRRRVDSYDIQDADIAFSLQPSLSGDNIFRTAVKATMISPEPLLSSDRSSSLSSI